MSKTRRPHDEPGKKDDQTSDETFTTDISESGEDGTTVREAEVRKDDLTEVEKRESNRP